MEGTTMKYLPEVEEIKKIVEALLRINQA